MKKASRLNVITVSLLLNLLLIVYIGLNQSQFFHDQKKARYGEDFDMSLQEFEEVGFARDFINRLISFEPESYRISQTALSFLMSPDLRADHLNEVSRLDSKIQKNAVSQKGELIALVRSRKNPRDFHAYTQVEIIERINISYLSRIDFSIADVEKSPENPRGFLVDRLSREVVTKGRLEEMLEFDRLRVFPKRAVLLRFPCTVEHVLLPQGSSIKMRLTTFDVSEVQIWSDRVLPTESIMKVSCQHQDFPIKISSALDSDLQGYHSAVVFRSFSPKFYRAEKKPMQKSDTGIHSKAATQVIKKTLEEQLGFIIENGENDERNEN